jgi:sugar transferase (PEP-CTERM system associated)
MKVLGHYVYVPIALLAATEFAAGALVFGAWATLFDVPSSLGSTPGLLLLWMAIFGAAVVAGLTAVGLYQAKQRLRLGGVIVRAAVGLAIAAAILAVLDFLFPLGMEGGLWIVSILGSLVVVSVARTVTWRWLDHELFRRRVLVYGAGKRAGNLLKLRRQTDRRGFVLVAFAKVASDSHAIADARVTELGGSILEFAREHSIDEIVVAMDDRRSGFPIAELLECKFAGIAVIDLVTFLERETGRVSVELVNPSWLIFSEGFRSSAGVELAARVLDVVTATLILVAASPLMVLAALAIVIEDGRPVLYRQRRVGFLGKPFTVYKFRSMIKNAEADGKPQWAEAADLRVTRTGRWFRKLRIDELPQLLNVLRGDMSLVGPRPERPEFVARLSQSIPYYHERHVVKPGLTGWAQLCYPYGSSDRDALEKLQYDLYYIKHKSLIFNLMVLLQTAEVVLWGKGAR